MKPKRFYASFHTFEHTYDAYPKRWYESKIGIILLSTTFFISAQYIIKTNGLLTNGVLSVFSVLLYLIGIAADIASTQYVSSLKPAFDKRGLSFPVFETAIGLPSVPSLRNHFLSLNAIITLLTVPLALLSPSLGIALCVSSIAAAIGNIRIYKRLTLTLEMTKA